MADKLPTTIDANGLAAITFLASRGASENECSRLSGYNLTEIRLILRTPAARAAIREGAQQWLEGELGPIALKTLQEFAESSPKSDAGKRIKLDAAKTLAGLAGYVPPKAPDGNKGEKPISEMSLEEIERELANKKRQAADKAKPVIDHDGGRGDDPKGAELLE